MGSKIKSVFTWISIAYILLGLGLLIWPEISMLLICRVFGAIMLIYGAVRIIQHFKNAADGWVAYSDMSAGVLCAILGLLLLLRPQLFIAILPMLMGIMIVVDSLMRLQSVLVLRRLGAINWGLQLVQVVLTLVLGVLLVINPFAGMSAVVMVMGAFLLADGIANLWDIFFVSRKIGEDEEISAAESASKCKMG